jgi:hypothetical protein
VPPKVAVPKQSAGTYNPEPPSCLYSIKNYIYYLMKEMKIQM